MPQELPGQSGGPLELRVFHHPLESSTSQCSLGAANNYRGQHTHRFHIKLLTQETSPSSCCPSKPWKMSIICLLWLSVEHGLGLLSGCRLTSHGAKLYRYSDGSLGEHKPEPNPYSQVRGSWHFFPCCSEEVNPRSLWQSSLNRWQGGLSGQDAYTARRSLAIPPNFQVLYRKKVDIHCSILSVPRTSAVLLAPVLTLLKFCR
jgi:hypothetical protein